MGDEKSRRVGDVMRQIEDETRRMANQMSPNPSQEFCDRVMIRMLTGIVAELAARVDDLETWRLAVALAEERATMDRPAAVDVPPSSSSSRGST